MSVDENKKKSIENVDGAEESHENPEIPPAEPGEPGDPENPDNPDNPDNPNKPVEPEPEPEPIYIYQTIDNFYNRVRGALGAGLSITDEMIDLYEYAPYAELQIVKKVPHFCCLTDIKYALFETCIVYMTCYALCPIASQMKIKRQKDPSLELEFSDSADKGNCSRFLDLIDDIITCQINCEERRIFMGFKVTPPSSPYGSRCGRHWMPPIYKELYPPKPWNGGSENNNGSENRPCCCPCNCPPSTGDSSGNVDNNETGSDSNEGGNENSES